MRFRCKQYQDKSKYRSATQIKHTWIDGPLQPSNLFTNFSKLDYINQQNVECTIYLRECVSVGYWLSLATSIPTAY